MCVCIVSELFVNIIFKEKIKLVTLVEGDQKAPFSIGSRGLPLRRLEYDHYYPPVWINSAKPSENDR